MVSVGKKAGIREVISKGDNSERLLEAIAKHLNNVAKSSGVLLAETKIADTTRKEERPDVV